MARQLESFPEPAPRLRHPQPYRPRPAQQKYPWADWSDGAEHLIVEGVDFAGARSQMARQLQNFAGRNKMTVSVEQSGPAGLRFEFHERT